MFRVTGRVVRTDDKSGTKVNEQTGEARNWAMKIYTVLVAEQAIVEFSTFGDSEYSFVVGDDIDVAVQVRPGRGSQLSVSLDKPWSEALPQPASNTRKVRAAS